MNNSEEKIWILRPTGEYGKGSTFADAKDDDPWNPWYDKCFGIVVQTKSEEEARQIAGEKVHKPGPEVWKSEKYIRCLTIEEYAEQENEVLIKDVAQA